MLARYRSILRVRGAPRLVLTALIARLPTGMNALAIVLLVRHGTGSFVDAGIVDAGFAIGCVVISPGQGRLIDRFGQPRVLIPSALISAAGLVGLVIAVDRHAALAVLVVLAAVGGGAMPPMSASMRGLWASVIPEADRRDTAFALESVLNEVFFVLGPLLTAVIVAAATASAAVLVSAVLTVVGTIAFATSRASREWRAEKAKRTVAGPLAGPGMRTLIISVVPMGLAFGTLEIAMPALATRAGRPAAAGILLAALAAGSLFGGLLYGMRRWQTPVASRYLILNALFAAGMAPLIIAGPIPLMVVLMAVAGLTLAPVSACVFALIEDVAPAGTTTEAFAWIFTANMTGAAAGAGIAGALIGSSGIRAALVVPVFGVALSFVIAFARRRTLEPLVAGVAGAPVVAGAPGAPVVAGAPVAGSRPGAATADPGVATATAAPPIATATPGIAATRPARARRSPGRSARAAPTATAGAAAPAGADPRRPGLLTTGIIVAAAVLGYRARDGRSNPSRRPRRR